MSCPLLPCLLFWSVVLLFSDALFAKGLLRVQQYLAGGRDNTTCPICLGGIKPTEAIWSCSRSCYALFHLPCIQVGLQNSFSSLLSPTIFRFQLLLLPQNGN